MTPAQVEQAARNKYNSLTSTFYSQDEVFKLIYMAELELATKALVIEGVDTSIATVAGTRAYSFPTGVIAIKRVEYNGQKLQKIDFRDDDMLTTFNSATTEQGSPLYYAEWNKTLYLRAIPDAIQTLTLYVYKEPTLLTTASTTLDVPTELHTDLIDYVTSELAAKDERFDISDRYLARWNDKVQKAIQWQKKRLRTDSFTQVRDIEQLGEFIIGTI